MLNKIDLMQIIDQYDYSHQKARKKAIDEMKQNGYTSKEMNLVVAIVDGYFSIRQEDQLKGDLYRRQALHQEMHLMY